MKGINRVKHKDPTPRPRAAWLPLTVLLVSVTLPGNVKMPPPSALVPAVLLPLTVLLVRDTLPEQRVNAAAIGIAARGAVAADRAARQRHTAGIRVNAAASGIAASGAVAADRAARQGTLPEYV